MTADHDTAHGHSSVPSPARRLIVGCGYLGTRVARRWLAAGDQVFGITRSQSRAEALAAERSAEPKR
jgi:nucleoside-diphosphate-sugar epimerase